MLGDRKDGKRVRNIDGMHYICPILYPKRCDNEAFIYEKIDLTNIDKYLKKKNKNNDGYKYNFFQVIVCTMLKILYLRPKMNYFIADSVLYERNEKTASFVVKKQFNDEAGEGLAVIHSKDYYTIDDVHNDIVKCISEQRSGKSDKSTDYMNLFTKIPRFISKIVVRFIMFLDQKGLCPSSLIETDPYYTSVVLTNLGSIDLHAGYHHLTNWGTNSLFVIVGQIKPREFIDENGKKAYKNSIDLGLTVDERIADGFYFAKTVKLIKYILEHPELLEEPMSAKVELCQEKKTAKSCK